VQNGVTTIYLGAIYEKNLSTGEVTTYYFAGSQRVAMRKGGNLYYFVTDHLGSTSVTLDASGNKIGEMRYYPFGETRYTSGSAPTDRRFTGQRQEDSSLGSLYDFNARFYSPVLGRFLSADTIVPSPSDPQQLNRYSYALNSPLNYIDPTGHAADAGGATFGYHRWLQVLATRVKNYVRSRPYGQAAPSWDSLPPDVQKGLSLGTLDAGGQTTKWSKTSWNIEFGTCDKSCPDVWAQHDLTGEPINQLIWTLGGTYFFYRIAAGAAVLEAGISEAEAGTAPVINPGFPSVGRTLNCVNCVVATDSTFAGYPASALPSATAQSISILENIYGRQFVSVAGKAQIESMLVDLGPGARAIVFGSRGAGVPGHVFNAVVSKSGVVSFWDGQIGRAASFSGYTGFELLITSP
jgi:RHS repeat-associated protein